jgi:ketopantoate reductase
MSTPLIIIESTLILFVICVCGYIKLRKHKHHRKVIQDLLDHVQNIGDAQGFVAKPKEMDTHLNDISSSLNPTQSKSTAATCPNCGSVLHTPFGNDGYCSICHARIGGP